MSSSPSETSSPPLSRSLVFLLASGAGLTVASLYFNQPMLEAIGRDLDVTTDRLGVVPMLTQLGYAAGILLFAPLGDRAERRRVIVLKTAGLAASLLIAAIAPSLAVLAAASFIVGLLASAAQDFVPAAASLAPPHARGKVVGTVMTGLLLGILLSRVVSGAVAEQLGWRAVFIGAAGIVVILSAISAWRLPLFPPQTSEPYGALLRSMFELMRTVAPLRRAALVQGLLCVAFSGFWSTLALGLAAPPFELGSTVAGAFGLAGAAGAVMAPLAGAMADKRGPLTVIRLGAFISIIAFGAMTLFDDSLVVLVLATVVFDLGIQASLISHQTIVYGLEARARSRLNALLISSMFIGMALGAAIASRVFAVAGFRGVTAASAAFAGLALVIRLLPTSASTAARLEVAPE